MGIESLTQLRKVSKSITEIEEIRLKSGKTYFLNPENYANPNLERSYVVNEKIIGYVYKAVLYIVEFSKAVVEFLEKRGFSYKAFYIPN